MEKGCLSQATFFVKNILFCVILHFCDFNFTQKCKLKYLHLSHVWKFVLKIREAVNEFLGPSVSPDLSV